MLFVVIVCNVQICFARFLFIIVSWLHKIAVDYCKLTNKQNIQNKNSFCLNPVGVPAGGAANKAINMAICEDR